MKEKIVEIKEDLLEVGEIVNTHGTNGELKIIPLTDNPGRFSSLAWVYIDTNGKLKKYTIESFRFHKNMMLLKFNEVDNLEDAARLKGSYLKIDRKNAIILPEYSYFICDLIGCEVVDITRGKLGILKDVLKTGSNDVYVIGIGQDMKNEILIPALKDIVKEVSIDKKMIKVSLPKGLIDD